MKLINLSYGKAYLAAFNKKFFAEIPRQNIELNKIKKLTPQTDIDSRI